MFKEYLHVWDLNILMGWTEPDRKKKEKQAKQGVQTNLSLQKRLSWSQLHLSAWNHRSMDAVECTEPHRPQNGMLTLNKTHRLGGSYETYTKVELFQLAKINLHWYLQYVSRNPLAGEALDTGHSGGGVPSLSLLTTSQISVHPQVAGFM